VRPQLGDHLLELTGAAIGERGDPRHRPPLEPFGQRGQRVERVGERHAGAEPAGVDAGEHRRPAAGGQVAADRGQLVADRRRWGGGGERDEPERERVGLERAQLPDRQVVQALEQIGGRVVVDPHRDDHALDHAPVDRDEQCLLGAEVVERQPLGDAGGGRDRVGGRRREPARDELGERGVEDAVAAGVAGHAARSLRW
jgi:hypothetical protein